MSDEPDSSFGERLKLAMDLRGMSQTALAATLGVSRGAVSGWSLDRYQPTYGHVVEMAKHLNVSREWLTRGAGPMEPLPPMRDPMVSALLKAKESAFRLLFALRDGKPVERIAEAERALELIRDDEIFSLVVDARDGLAAFVESANDSLEAGTAVDFMRLHEATTSLSQLGDYVPPVDLIKAILEARERYATGRDVDGAADAKRQAARDASPEGTTDVLVIDDKWEQLSEATQKAAKESKG